MSWNLSSFLASCKEAVALVGELKNVETKSKLIEALKQAQKLAEELEKKDSRIKELEQLLTTKPKVVKDGSAYYECDAAGKAKGDPYCTRCWEVDHKLVHIHQMQGSGMMRGTSQCPECEKKVPWARKK